jgi:hypothetical protein
MAVEAGVTVMVSRKGLDAINHHIDGSQFSRSHLAIEPHRPHQSLFSYGISEAGNITLLLDLAVEPLSFRKAAR